MKESFFLKEVEKIGMKISRSVHGAPAQSMVVHGFCGGRFICLAFNADGCRW